jgi:hypothetical protein
MLILFTSPSKQKHLKILLAIKFYPPTTIFENAFIKKLNELKIDLQIRELSLKTSIHC